MQGHCPDSGVVSKPENGGLPDHLKAVAQAGRQAVHARLALGIERTKAGPQGHWPRPTDAYLDNAAGHWQFAPMNFPDWERLSVDPGVMGGKPCIRGTRLTVGTFVGLVARKTR